MKSHRTAGLDQLGPTHAANYKSNCYYRIRPIGPHPHSIRQRQTHSINQRKKPVTLPKL